MPQHNEHRLRFFGAILLTAIVAAAYGAYVATVIVTESVKQETRRADRIR